MNDVIWRIFNGNTKKSMFLLTVYLRKVFNEILQIISFKKLESFVLGHGRYLNIGLTQFFLHHLFQNGQCVLDGFLHCHSLVEYFLQTLLSSLRSGTDSFSVIPENEILKILKNCAKFWFFFFVKKIVKLNEDLHCLANM